MGEYYARDGREITFDEYVKIARGGKRVAETTLPDGKWVSTVWLGLNHQYYDGPPLIFETMVFESREMLHEVDCRRYSTEEAAKDGHDRMVARWTAHPNGDGDEEDDHEHES